MGPVIHVAGTNGKGSTCAYLRAIGEAAGLRVHVLASPHLVRFAERIRIAGQLIGEDEMDRRIDEVEAANAGQPISFFEITTCLAYQAFARAPADLVVVEVGSRPLRRQQCVRGAGRLGDRADRLRPPRDAWPRAAQDRVGEGRDHQARPSWLVARPARTRCAALIGARSREPRRACDPDGPRLRRLRGARGLVVQLGEQLMDLPPPSLFGPRTSSQRRPRGWPRSKRSAIRASTEAAIGRGIASAQWPGRFQSLTRGPLAAMARARGADLWLDAPTTPRRRGAGRCGDPAWRRATDVRWS